MKRRTSDPRAIGPVSRLGLLERSALVDTRTIDLEARTVELSFSSEEPVERYFGHEVLGHGADEVDLSRLNASAPVLLDHQRTGGQVGVVERAWVAQGRGRCLVRFSKRAEADAELADIADGIRVNVSVGYIVHEMRLESSGDDGDVYRVTRWTPLEVSMVSIPADPTVGVGRHGGDDKWEGVETLVRGIESRTRPEEGNEMKIQVVRLADGAVVMIDERDFDAAKYERMAATPAPAPAAPAPTPAPVDRGRDHEGEIARARQEAAEAERQRVEQIRAVGARFNCAERAAAAISAGVSFEAFRWEVWEQQPAGTPLHTPRTSLGLSQREVGSYSILRAAVAQVSNNWTDAGFERECSQEIERRLGQVSRGVYVPSDVLYLPSGIPLEQAREASRAMQTRQLTTGADGAVVATNLLTGSFIDLLRNQSVIMAMGATTLPGLVGNVDIPRQTAGAVAGHIAEASDSPDTELGLDVVSMTPKTLAGRTRVTRRMQLQSTPAIEGFVRADLATAIALGMDSAGINGAGSATVPEGILNAAGIGLVPLGANGAAPTWASIVNLIRECKVDNADRGRQGFVTNATGWAKLMTTPKVASTDSRMLLEGETLLMRRFMDSEQIPSDLTKGSGTNLSAMIYGGNWADLLVGEWGTLELQADPYTDGDAGGLVLRVFMDYDIALRHEESFSAIVDMVTV